MSQTHQVILDSIVLTTFLHAWSKYIDIRRSFKTWGHQHLAMFISFLFLSTRIQTLKHPPSSKCPNGFRGNLRVPLNANPPPRKSFPSKSCGFSPKKLISFQACLETSTSGLTQHPWKTNSTYPDASDDPCCQVASNRLPEQCQVQ